MASKTVGVESLYLEAELTVAEPHQESKQNVVSSRDSIAV